MAILQDLVPDPTTKDLWYCRPAAALLQDLSGNPFSSGFSSGFGSGLFPGAGFISCFKVIGTRIYGMIATSTNPGHDQPFIFDVPSLTFIPITGITNANTPQSPLTTGAWNPPNLDLIGSKLIFAHSGFTGAGGNFFGILDISNPAAPVWSAGNTATNALIAPPQWVQNFNGRCFFFVNPTAAQPAAYMSDQLNPTVITNATQILTFGDNVPLTCAVGLPLQSQLGGIIQSLMVFKGITNIFQVTGDFSLSTLALNTLNVATGTLAPNAVAATSKGLCFVAPDGIRQIDQTGKVGDPIGFSGEGVTLPFLNALIPSRMCAAYNNGVYRVQVQNSNAPGNPQQQWGYDFVRQVFHGPHTQAASLMDAYAGTWIVTLQGRPSAFFTSDLVQSAASTFIENGRQLQFAFGTPMLPDTEAMAMVKIIETTLNMATVAGSTTVVTAQDQDGAVLDVVSIVPAGGTTLWGAFIWGQALWQGVANALFPRVLKWHAPLIFRRMGITASGNCAAGVKLGRIYLRYQVLGYLQQRTA